MTEADLQLLLRAKNQIKREATWRSFLTVGIVFAAMLRLIGFDLPTLYFLIFTLFIVLLLLTSDLLLNIGTVTKRDLVSLIENTVHSDPAILSKYASLKHKA